MPSQRARNVSAVIDRLWAEAQSPEAKAEVHEIAKRANTDYGFWKKIADGPQMPTLGWGPEIGASVVSGGIAQKVPSLIGKRLAALPMAIYGAGHLGEGLLRRFEGLPETGEQIFRGGSELAFGLPGLFPGVFKQTAAKAADNIPTSGADDIPTFEQSGSSWRHFLSGADDIPTPVADDITGRPGREAAVPGGAATGRPQPPTPASPERIATIRGRIVETARQGRVAELDNFISQYAETVEAFTPEDITAFTTLVNKISPVSMSRLLRREGTDVLQETLQGDELGKTLKAIDDLGPDRLAALRQPKEIQRAALRSIKGEQFPSGGLLTPEGTITRESAGQYLAEAGGLPPELIQTMSDDELFETAGVFALDQTEYLHSRVKKLLEKLGYGGGTSQNIWKYQGRHTQSPFQKIVETDRVLPKSLKAMGGREIPTEFGGDRTIGYLAEKFKSSFLKATEPGVKAGRLEMLARELQRVDLALALALLGLEGGRRAHVGSEGVANAAIG